MALAVGGDASADFGAPEQGESGWQYVCAAKRKRGKKRKESGDKEAPVTVNPGMRKSQLKKVRFAAMSEVIDIVESGFDDYTFDNFDEQGRRRVNQPRDPDKPIVQVSDDELTMRRLKHRKHELLAHEKAVRWITGQIQYLRPAHESMHQGRVFYVYPVANDDPDVPFTLRYDRRKEGQFKNYSLLPVAIWDEDYVFRLSTDGKLLKMPRSASLDAQVQTIKSLQTEHFHVGLVPGGLNGGDLSAGLPAGQAREEPVVIQWVVDTGAAVHLMSADECRRAGYRTEATANQVFNGVGADVSSSRRAIIKKFGTTGIGIQPSLLKGDHNLLSGKVLCDIAKADLIWMGSLNLPPYLVLPNRKAVVLQVVNGVPVYEQNNPSFDPEEVVWHGALPVPASLAGVPVLAGPPACPVQAGMSEASAIDGDAPIDGDAEVDNLAVDGDVSVDGGASSSPVYGPPTKSEVDLRKEARSTKHLLRHKPFNRYCEDCCKSKMAQRRHFAGSYKRDPKKWGEIVTADHLVSHKKGKKHGVRGFKNAVNIKDLWSGLIASVPVKDKGHEETRKAFKWFCGGRKIQRIYSDNSGELIAAADKLGVPHEPAEPGVPVSNAIAERNNQDILNMAKPALCRAGLPACCWPFAAPHACFMENTHWEDGRESAWAKTHRKGEFTGPKVPFGARVWFKPSETRLGDVPGKWEPDSLEGVFAGYLLSPGYQWTKQFLVWAVTDFDGLEPRKGIRAEDFPVREPFKVSRLVIPDGEWQFPMKARYDHINHAVEGDVDRAALEQSPFLPPPNMDAADQDAVQQEAPNYVVENIPRYDEDLLPDINLDEADLGDNILDNPAPTDQDPSVIGGDAPADGEGRSMLDRWAEDGPPAVVDMNGNVPPSGNGEEQTATTTTSSTSTSISSSSSSSSSSSAPPVVRQGGGSGGDVPTGPRPGGPKPEGKPNHKGEHGEVYVDGKGRRYRCSSYKRGDSMVNTWYEIDESGTRILGNSTKPPDVDSKKWAQLNHEEQLQEIRDYHDRVRDQRACADDGDVPIGGHAAKSSLTTSSKLAACAPMGLLGFNKPLAAQVTRWTNEDNKLQEVTLDNYCVDEDRAHQLLPEHAPPDQELPWDHWDNFIEEMEATGKALQAFVVGGDASADNKAVSSMSGDVSARAGTCLAAPSKRAIPAMPTIPYKPEHRPKLRLKIPIPACVARPVSRRERRNNIKAAKAMKDEWDRLRSLGTWDEYVVREWSDVAREARNKGEEVHFGYLLGLCFEKGSELEDGDPGKKFKGRAVFQGDRVVNQNWEIALFQDLGSSPATLEASRACDAFGCVPGHKTEIADAPAAYVQADLKGTPCWVHMPEEAWPDDPVLRASFERMRKPVVQLKKALYGHPDSGTFWEKHCDEHVRKVGFEPMGPEWPSCYFHPKLNLFLVIYVDDFKMSGPPDNLQKGWDLIAQGLNIDKPQDINGQSYLGCRHERYEIDLPGGGKATVDSKNMTEFMQSCVQLYLDLAPGTTLQKVATPFLPEDQHESPARAPAGSGPVEECPWCRHTFAPDPYPSISDLQKARRSQQSSGSGGDAPTGSEATSSLGGDSSARAEEAGGADVRGRLAPVAAKILMKVLYGARCARLDLLRAVSHLACYFTKWTSRCDAKLHRLMCYINSTLDHRMVGWIGDKLVALQPHLFADADLAGCVDTQRSTSGYFLVLRGPNSCFPIAGISKRQTCVSHSTPEAEMVSMNLALRHCGLPCLDLWHALLPNKPGLVVHEDNQAMIRVVESGRNPTMRYLGRTHGISVAWLHETFQGEDLTLAYEVSARMCADIFTKAFNDADKWKLACWLICVCNPAELDALAKRSKEWDTPPTQTGGKMPDNDPKTGGTKISGASGGGDVSATAAREISGTRPGGNGGDASAVTPSPGDSGGDVSAAVPENTMASKDGKPQESTSLKELRLGRCFTYKQQAYKAILGSLHKTFKKEMSNTEDQNPDRAGRPVAQNSELSGQDGELTWCTSTSARCTPQQERLVRAINKLIEDKTREHQFYWGGIRVTAGNQHRTHYDMSNNSLSLAMLFGEFSGGNFVSGGINSNDTGKMFVYDGRGSFDSEQSSGTRFLVEAFMHDGVPKWTAEYRQYLTTLGFRLPASGSGGDASAAAEGSSNSGGDASTAVEQGANVYRCLLSEACDRVLVEGCCEKDSLLQKRTKYSRGCRVVPITKDDDFASEAGMRKCIESLCGSSDTLWFSAPCTGGSTWQFINLKRGDKTVAKIKLHWKLFKRLWAAFEVVATHALNVGARVFVEWPRRCAYWKNDRVVKFLSRYGFVFTDFDGCMFGLVATRGRDAGMPIQKPWRIACSPNSCLPSMLNRRCDGSHDHTPCAGQNTLLTQGYTPEIAQLVHQSIVRDIATANKAKAESTDNGATHWSPVASYAGRSVLCVGIDEMDESMAIAALS